jgi:hypothetical protein
MKGKRDADRRGKARSNEHEGCRMNFIRKVYMRSRARIETKFLEKIGARNLSMRDREFSLMSYREGALEMLDAIEKIFGVEGMRDVSRYLVVCEDPLAERKQDEDEAEEEGDEESEDDYVRTPIDDEPWTYEKVDPKGVDPWEHLRGMPRFPFELVDKEEEPSGPEPAEEEEDEEEEIELDIMDRVANWDEVRDLWKDFDPAYR